MRAFSLARAGIRGIPLSARGFRTSTPRLVAVGEKFPTVQLDYGFPPEKVDMAKRLASKKTIIVGLPGAFTPT
jgi:2-Cys peroxiredoxin 5